MSAQVEALRRLLEREAAQLVRRLTGFTEARYAAAAPPFGSRAEVVRHLAGLLAEAGQGVEQAGSDDQPAWRALPDLPALSLADAVAVTAHDLVTALELPGPAVWTPAGRRSPAEVCAGMLAEVVLHRRDIDGSRPGSETAGAVLEVLAPASPRSPAAVLAVAAERCPAYRPWRSG